MALDSNVVSLDEYRPHGAGEAVCLQCRHVWVAVFPLPLDWLECPSCGTSKGTPKYPFQTPSKTMYVCSCDNDLFTVTPDGIFCPSCAAHTNPWAEGKA